MNVNSVKCKAVEVRTDSGVCAGLARTRQGEECIIDGRTPEANGMCSNAFCSLANAAFIMMATDKMPGEKDGSLDRVCPHGIVTFRMSRSAEDKKVAYKEK
jgi:uncharacterized repeat protein (TIGR04076 family)